MFKFNSIRSVKYLLYLIVIFVTGCAEHVTRQSYVNETPPAVSVLPPLPATHFGFKREDWEYASVREKNQDTDSEPVSYATVWERMIALYAFPDILNKRIDREMVRYLKNPEYLLKVQKRAEPYLYHILEQIEEKQLPGELALLPIVESAFIPRAVSRSKAAGLWQFIPATGRLFGLKQNWWYDGRRDVFASTHAATSYLKQLSEEFNHDWMLALASYNAGKGNVGKAIRRNRRKKRGTDYWSLSLPRETMRYVPRLLALAKIFAHADAYKMTLHPIPNKPYFASVKPKSPVNLKWLAKKIDMPYKKLRQLNPGIKRNSTPPNENYHLLVHVDKADKLNAILKSEKSYGNIAGLRHRIKKGETLSLIAKKYHVSVRSLQESNQLNSHFIRAGHVLQIPATRMNSRIAKVARKSSVYVVKKGDTFWDIARRFSVSSKQLAIWNNISLTKTLQPGQRLIVRES